jgi:hypothetical protein
MTGCANSMAVNHINLIVNDIPCINRDLASLKIEKAHRAVPAAWALIKKISILS